MDDAEHNLFSGLLAILRPTPERYNSLWTGLRHGLCRSADGKDSFLVQFWLARPSWASDDPRRVQAIAVALASFHAGIWRELRGAWERAAADAEAADMLIDLYRDLATHLGKGVAQDRRRLPGIRLPDLPLSLLDTIHARVLSSWPNGDASERRLAVVNAYEQRRAELSVHLRDER
jgi:hypothetical protein